MKEDDKLQPLIDQLEQGVASVQSEEGFKAWIDFQSKFYKYSPSNCLLIMLQRPDATMIASYGRWQQLKRQVRKGERSIKIFAPLIKKERNPDTGEDEKKLLGYKPASVFDVSQTDGEDLPDFNVPRLTGDHGRELYDRMRQVAWNEGLLVQRGGDLFNHRMEAMGYLAPERKTIAIRSDVDQLQATNTLAHELAHFYGNDERSDTRTEPIAQGTADVVLGYHGYSTAVRTYPYLAGWLKEAELTKALMGHIGHRSRIIIDKVDAIAEEGHSGVRPTL